MPETLFGQGQQLEPFAFETLTVAATAVGLTAATYAPATYGSASRAIITVETAQIRWREDGTAPTATVGHIANAGDVITLEGVRAVALFQAIRTGGTSASLSVSYERLRLPQ